jgi:hypothetical protein
MSRFVVLTRTGLAAGGTEPPDGFGARLTKYLPTDIVSIYTITIGGLVSAKPDKAIAPWIAFGLMVVFCAATFVYFKRKAPEGDVKRAHLGAWFIGWIAIIGQAIAALAAWLLGPHD